MLAGDLKCKRTSVMGCSVDGNDILRFFFIKVIETKIA